MLKPLLATALLLASSSLVLAAEVGRVEFQGRQIILEDNNSWRYADEQQSGAAAGAGTQTAARPADCVEIASATVPLSFCLSEQKWALANLGDTAEKSFKVKDREIYVMMITEPTEMKAPDLKRAILINAQNAAGLKPVQTVGDETVTLDGHEFGKLAYDATIDGNDLSYVNLFASYPGKGSSQMVFFSAASDKADLAKVVDELTGTVKVAD